MARLCLALLFFLIPCSLHAQFKIACIGDSLTASSYPAILKQICKNRCQVKTWATPGATEEDVMIHLLKALDSDFDSTHVVVYSGINDCMNSPNKWKEHYEGLAFFTSLILDNGKIPIVISHHAWSRKSVKGNQCSTRINELMFSKLKARVVNTSSLSDKAKLLSDYDAGDGLHLNKLGYRKLAQLVWQAISGEE